MGLTIFITLIALLPLIPGKITPELSKILERTLPDEKILVIVHMSADYPYSVIQQMNPQQRCALFRDIAYHSQRGIIEYLKALPKEKVEIGGQFWIFNGFHLKATMDIIYELTRNPDIWFISENGTVQIENYYRRKDNLPDSPEWNIKKVMADSCWAAGYSGEGIILGHIDTGVDVNHPALNGKWLSPYWLDGVNGQTAPYDDYGHGTHTMGTICGGDGPGPFPDDIGVAFGAKFIPTKGFNQYGYGTYEWIDTCMQYLADLKMNGVDIRAIGNSWGFSNPTNLHFWAIILNWKNLDVFPIFAAGNAHPQVVSPASYPTTIAVGATDLNDNIAYFSCPGPAPNVPPWNDPQYWYYADWNLLKPDISAPGVNIRSAIPGGGYDVLSGTSMATPHIAGGTAILLQKNPNLNVTDLYLLFCENCDKPPQGQPYPNYNYGWGKVNLWRALNMTPYPGTPGIPTVVKPFDCVRLRELQPNLCFYALDPDGDSVQFQILWDTDYEFPSPESVITSLYPSGDTINFIFPFPLIDGETYWWKVRCRDPDGTGYWSQYTISRSFTISTHLALNTCSWFQTKGEQFESNLFWGTVVQGDSVLIFPNNQNITDTIFEVYFEGYELPPGWTVIDGNGDGFKWTAGTTDDLGSYTPPGYGTRYAYYSDDDAGYAINYNEALVSPAIYVGGITGIFWLRYSYGFLAAEPGEKFLVKMRKNVDNNWSDWITLREYIVSSSGIGAVSLNPYLPADSMQFAWVYNDSASSQHWGWACACDNVVLAHTYTIYSDSGKMTGVGVNFQDLSKIYPRQHWGDVVWHKATPLDSIGIQVEFFNGVEWQLVPDTLTPNNSVGIFSDSAIDTLSLTELDTVTFRMLRLKALFYRNAKSPNDPALLDWELGNLFRYMNVGENFSPRLLRSQCLLEISPNPFKNVTSIKFQVPSIHSQREIEREESMIMIKLYDVSGRLVRRFKYETHSGQRLAKIIWRGDDDFEHRVPSGVYFCQLQFKKEKEVAKIILIR